MPNLFWKPVCFFQSQLDYAISQGLKISGPIEQARLVTTNQPNATVECMRCIYDNSDLILHTLDCQKGLVERTVAGFPLSLILAMLGGFLIALFLKQFIQKPKPKEQVEQEEPEGFATETKAVFQVKDAEKFDSVLSNIRELTTQGALECPAAMQTALNVQAKVTGGKTTKKPMVEYWEFFSIENKTTGEIFVKHRIENIPENVAMFNLIKGQERAGIKRQLEAIAKEEGLQTFKIEILP